MESKIKPEEIALKIQSVKYLHEGVLTFCVITMLSGFVVTGQSASSSVELYDKSKGDKMAYRDAFAKLHLMEQYMRREAEFTNKTEKVAA